MTEYSTYLTFYKFFLYTENRVIDFCKMPWQKLRKRLQNLLDKSLLNNRGSAMDKGSIYVVVILTLLIFGGYILVGGTIPTRLPALNTNIVNVVIPSAEPSKSSLQLYTFEGVTNTPYPTYAPPPTTSPNDPKLIDCSRKITGSSKPQMIWGFNYDPAKTSLEIFYENLNSLLLGSGAVTQMSKTPTDSVLNPAIGNAAALDADKFPVYPSLFLTDITTLPGDVAGDSQDGGQANKLDAIYGTWKGAGAADPLQNGLTLGGGADAWPPGNGPNGDHSTNFSSEAVWNVHNLKAEDSSVNSFPNKTFLPVQDGHSYRVQVVLHDGAAPGNIAVACFL